MAADMSSEDGRLCFRLEDRNASKEREPKGTSVNEGDLQRAFDGLTEYIKEDYKEEIRLGRTRPELDPIGLKQEGPLIKPTKGSLFHVELTKSANNSEFKKYLKTIEDWKSLAKCSVWMSSTLPADLSFSTDNKPPDCVIVQAFVIGSDLFPYVLTLYDEKKGTKEAASKYTVDTARLLSRSLYQQYHGSFYLLPVTLPAAENEFNLCSLATEITDQIEFAKKYIKKLEKLKQDEYEKLRETTAVLSSMSHVPGEEENANKFLLYDIKWREALHLAIEKLHTAEGNAELLYTPQNEKKVEALLLEAVRRLGRMYRINIFTKRTDVQACVRKLQQRADPEGGCKLLIGMDVKSDSARDVISVKILKDKSADNTAKEETTKSKPKNKKKSTIGTRTARDQTPAFYWGETGGELLPSLRFGGGKLISQLRQGCAKCTEFGASPVLAKNLPDCDKKEAFRSTVNAFLNGEGGTILVHTAPGKRAGVCTELLHSVEHILPEGLRIHETVKREFVDGNHIKFTVVAKRHDLLSTLRFNTFVSRSSDLIESPTQSQLTELVKKVSDPAVERAAFGDKDTKSTPKFEKGRRVTLQDGMVQEIESLCSSRPDGVSMDYEEFHRVFGPRDDPRLDYEDFHSGFSDDPRLAYLQYLRSGISALSKEETGGRVYFGIRKVSSDGEFVCEGITLNSENRTYLEASVRDMVVEDMLWLSHSPPNNPVEVRFHSVADDSGDSDDSDSDRMSDNGNSNDLCVMEVAVKYFHGICFTDKRGPEAYRWSEAEMRRKRIPVEEWIEKTAGKLKQQTPIFSPAPRQEIVTNWQARKM